MVQAEIPKMLRSMPEDDSLDLAPDLKEIKRLRSDALLYQGHCARNEKHWIGGLLFVVPESIIRAHHGNLGIPVG